MTQKINGVDPRPVALGGQGGVSRVGAPGSESRPQGAAAEPANVRITDDARRLGELERAVAAASAFDELRVAELGRAVEQGQFKVEAERIAERLLRQEYELAGARRERDEPA